VAASGSNLPAGDAVKINAEHRSMIVGGRGGVDADLPILSGPLAAAACGP